MSTIKQMFLVRDSRVKQVAVFLPLHGVAFLVDQEGAKKARRLIASADFNWERFFLFFPSIPRDIFQNKEAVDEASKAQDVTFFNPTAVSLFTTLSCPLQCVYCYADSSSNKNSMNLHLAKKAIDLALENAAKEKRDGTVLEFHGGGEPTFNWEVLVGATEYFQKRAATFKLQPFVKIVTNGFVSEEQGEWLSRNIDGLCVSLDGPKEIHDLQRPILGGRSSFDRIFGFIKRFDREGKTYTLRATITSRSVSEIPRIATFFFDSFKNAVVALEPLHFCGRCFKTKWRSPKPVAFVEKFIGANILARERGRRLIFSGFQLDSLRHVFCGVTAPNFIVLPNGSITACTEISEASHLLANPFIYGSYLKTRKRFIVDRERIMRLRSFRGRSTKACEECFCQYHCAGECLLKNLQQGGVAEKSSRCSITKSLAKHYIFSQFET